MKTNSKSYLLALTMLVSPILVSAQSQLIEKYEAPAKSSNISYEKWKLPNGLTVIMHEDHSDPIVHLEVTYHVGSNRESIGKSGFAHLFEHMMFQGSSNVKDEEHFKIIQGAGGNMNGTTNEDRTNYFETVPSNYLETTLWLESDRMGYLLDSLTQKKFEVQRSTVKNEKGQNVENQAYGLAFAELIGQALYPAGHPYSWPVIGYVDDLNRVTLKDVKEFFMRWYGPNNAVLTIAGDMNPTEALKLVEKYFGSIPRGPEVKKIKADQPILAIDQYASYTDHNAYFPMAIMTFPTVPMYNKDEPALDILAGLMGDGNNSIFYKNFVKNEKAINAQVGHGAKELAGEFQVIVMPYPDKTFNEVEKEIRETIDQFEKEGITEEGIARQKAKIETRLTSYFSSIAGKSAVLTSWELYYGKPINASDELERYKKVTKEDVARVYNKYIKGKHAAIVNVYPKDPMDEKVDSVKSVNPYANYKPVADPQYAGLKYVKPVDNFNRSIHPTPTPAKSIKVPSYYSSKLGNGLKIIGTQTSELPMVNIVMEIEGGNLVLDKAEKAGLSELTAAVIEEDGTKRLTAEQFSAELDKLGSSISFTGSKQNTQVTIETLTKNLDATLKLFEEILLTPRLSEENFYRIRKQLAESINSNKRNAGALSSDAFNNLIYGNNIFGAYITGKAVKKLSIDDVRNYYAKYYSPSVSSLTIVGDITEKDALAKLQFLNKWEAKEVKMPVAGQFAPVEKTQIYLVNKNKATQSMVNVGQSGLAYDATGEYFKASVMNFSLGGSFNSRINLNLREDKGFTYGARSGFMGSKFPGVFSVSTSVRSTATDSSITEIMKEIKNYVKTGITDDELSFTRNSLLSSDALKYETPYQKAGFLARISKYNLSSDYVSKQSDILKQLSKSDINMTAQKYINPDKMVIVVVGDKIKLKKSLEALGYGKVKEVFVD